MISKILILDSNDRRKKIKETVKSLSCEINVVAIRSASEDVSEHGFGSVPHIALVHKNDLEPDVNGVTGIHDSVKLAIQSAKIVVAYTGGSGGLFTPTIRGKASEWLYQNSEHWYGVNCKVDSSEYDNPGMKEIVEWASCVSRSEEDLPRLLGYTTSVEFQTALSILCQGYLATEAMCNSRCIKYQPSDDFGKALIGMGWAAANGDLLELSGEVVDLGLEVKDDLAGIGFWLEPFDPEKTRDWKTVLERLRSQLKFELKREIPEAISDLLCAIEIVVQSDGDAANSRISPAIVARAFLFFYQEAMQART